MGKAKDGVNRVLLVGRVSGEPRWHKVGKNRWLHFTLVTEEMIHGIKETFLHEEFHHVCVYGVNPCLANCEMKNDDIIFVQGRLCTHAFTDTEGIKRYKTEIIAASIERIYT